MSITLTAHIWLLGDSERSLVACSGKKFIMLIY